jgi:Xaa-Pro aminopeptidase
VESKIKALRAVHTAAEVDKMQRWVDYATTALEDKAELNKVEEPMADEATLRKQLDLVLRALCTAIPTQVGWQY